SFVGVKFVGVNRRLQLKTPSNECNRDLSTVMGGGAPKRSQVVHICISDFFVQRPLLRSNTYTNPLPAIASIPLVTTSNASVRSGFSPTLFPISPRLVVRCHPCLLTGNRTGSAR